VQSVFTSRGLIRIVSLVQAVLALVGLALLFGTPWAYYQVYGQIGYYNGYRYYSVWFNAPANAGMGLLTAGFTVLFIFVALFGMGWGWLSNRSATKYAKLTMIFGIVVIVLSALAAVVITAQEASVYPDAAAAGNVSWSLSTALTGFLIGGILFIIIGFIGTRMTRLAQVPPPPPPLPPPPPSP